MIVCLLTFGVANAQEGALSKAHLGVWTDFHFGACFLGGSHGFSDYMLANHPALDYHSSYLGAITGGVGVGVEYRNLTLGLYVDAAEGGNSVAVKNQFVKKDDALFHLDLGYRIPIAKILTLEPTVGIGFGTSDIFLATSRGGADYVNSFTTANLIVPLTLNFTAVGKGGDIGIYLQYIVSVGQLGTTHITGLDTEVADLHFQPSTLTFGVKYCFMP